MPTCFKHKNVYKYECSSCVHEKVRDKEAEKKANDQRNRKLLKQKVKQAAPRKTISKNPKTWSNTFLCSDGTRVTQAEINERRAEAYDKAYPGWREKPKTCHGCWKRKQQGFAHIIAQARCKQLGKTELIWYPGNFFPADIQCNSAIESPNGKNWKVLLNIEPCLAFIKEHDQELFTKFELAAIDQSKPTI